MGRHRPSACRFERPWAEPRLQPRARLLVIVDQADHMVTPEPALEFAEAAGAPVLTLESGCGHMGPWCATGEVAAAVRRFLREP